MSTRAQRRAARRNAQMSTGPRTEQGKAVSSRNAIRHNLSGTTFVLLPNEDRAAFDSLVREYRREWNPQSEHETFLVTQMVQARWRLNRIARMEAEVIDAMLSKFGDGQSDEGAMIIADAINPGALAKLHRYAQDAERSYNRAVRELRAYRVERSKSPADSSTCEKIQNEPEYVQAPSATPQYARHSVLLTPDSWLPSPEFMTATSAPANSD